MIIRKKKPKKSSPVIEALRQLREEEWERSQMDGKLRTLTPERKPITPEEIKKTENKLKKHEKI